MMRYRGKPLTTFSKAYRIAMVVKGPFRLLAQFGGPFSDKFLRV